MTTIPQVAERLQSLFDSEAEQIGRRNGLIRRRRKLTSALVLKMLVLTLLRTPRPKTRDYVTTAAELGLRLSYRAVEKRFTPRLVAFLRAMLPRVLESAIAAKPVAPPLVRKFTGVFVGDTTTVPLPEGYAEEFPGCGGKSDSGKAALKCAVLWELGTGKLVRFVLEPGRHSDARSAVIDGSPPAGSLSLWDLGFFCLRRFRSWSACGAYWISRLQPGTSVFDPDGRPLDLRERLRQHPWDGPLDLAVLLGSVERVASRLIALRVPAEVAARRRQKAYEKAQKSGRVPSRDHLEWCDWTILITNCEAELLTWREVVVLYRSRWQIELLFKLWKSNNLLATPGRHGGEPWRMAELWGKMIGVMVQHRLLLTTSWLGHGRSLIQAAAVLGDWIGRLLDALGDRDRLIEALNRFQFTIEVAVRVSVRGKKPSWFQLISDPELLEYTC